MNKMLLNKGLLALTLSAGLVLTGCGGSSSSGGGGSSSGGGSDEPMTSGYSEVEGPLDAVQQPLSEQVLAPIVAGAAGTPLEGPVSCVTSFVVTDVLDVLDSLLVNLDPATLQSDPTALFTDSAETFQATITELASDLPVALASLAGEECAGSSDGGDGGDSTDPLDALAGTPLAPLAEALAPVLELADGGGSGEPPTPSVLLEQLSTAFSEGLATILAQAPSEIGGAPVLGGLLTTLDQTLVDLTATAVALEDQEIDAASAAVSMTLENLLNGLLIDVIPVGFIEDQSGQGPVVSSQIEAATAALAGLLGGGFGDFPGEGFENPADALFGPLSDTFLAGIQEALTGGLNGGDGGSNVGGFDALLEVLAPLQELLSGDGQSGDEALTGTPLDILLTPLVSALDGGASACPLDATPLAALCDVATGLSDALALNGNADLAAVLSGLVDTLLGGLLP